MRFQNVKSISEIVIPGVVVEADQVGDSIKALTFSVDGKIICRAQMDSYNLYLQRPADPKTKEVYRVAGTVLALPVSKDFDAKWDADEEAARLKRGVEVESEAALTVEKVSIAVEE